MSATTEDPAAKRKLSKATQILFWVAVESHSLAEQFGIEVEETDTGKRMKFLNVPRPWLKPHPANSDELSFDPDEYAKTLYNCSDYTTHMRLWILNVWNSSYARSQGWHFDLFKALNGLDDGNHRAIAKFLQFPTWP